MSKLKFPGRNAAEPVQSLAEGSHVAKDIKCLQVRWGSGSESPEWYPNIKRKCKMFAYFSRNRQVS